jgi:hypothetical protein
LKNIVEQILEGTGTKLKERTRSNAVGADRAQTPNHDRRPKPASVITRLYADPDPRFSGIILRSENN